MSQTEMILDTFHKIWGRWKTVGKFRRKSNDKIYETPRIILDSRFSDFMGKRFKAHRGRATLTDYSGERKGEYIILFFPDSIAVNRKQVSST